MAQQIHPVRDYDKERDPLIQARRNELFNQYIQPNLNLVYKLCIQYSRSPETVKENYATALTMLYRGVETYNPLYKIATWIHVCVKRHVFVQEKRREKYNGKMSYNEDLGEMIKQDSPVERHKDYGMASHTALNPDNYRQFYNDDILKVLDTMNPYFRNAIVYQMSGYSPREIAKMEHENGNLPSGSVNTIEKRLALAKQTLRAKLTRDGEKRT